MADKYRISVIMGIYNCAPTLAEALDSLLAQTYQSFKVIICDDGSTDNTVEVAKQYVDRYPGKFVLIKNGRNLKLAAALNHCLEYVDTEYVARMDGDDISLPHRFEEEVKFLDEHTKYVIVSSPMMYFDDDGVFRIGVGKGEVRKEDFIYGSPISHAPCMVKTEAYKAVGGYAVDKNWWRVEDYHLWIKMYAAGYFAFNLEEPLYQMRDDRRAVARRSWTNRLNEFRVQNFAVSALHLPFRHRIYSLRPLLLALLPTSVYMWLRKKCL